MTLYSAFLRATTVACLFLVNGAFSLAQEQIGKATEKPPDKPAATIKATDKATVPFQIQLLETRIRFEANGDSRKEVHTIIKLNNAAGAQQFSRLGFDYNRTFQQVEIPVVRITHANGGTSDLLPSAVTDAPNPAVEKYPLYHDARLKSVRVLGLQEGDSIEYRVITATSHQPLAPDFWLEHTFDRSGQVLEEHYVLDLPATRVVEVWTSKDSSAFDRKESGQGDEGRVIYSWNYPGAPPIPAGSSDATGESKTELPAYLTDTDVAVTTYKEWAQLATALQGFFPVNAPPSAQIKDKSVALTAAANTTVTRLRKLYEFVAQGIATVDLSPNAVGFTTHTPEEIVAAGYATPEDKAVLLVSLAKAAGIVAKPAFTGLHVRPNERLPVLPSVLTNVLVLAADGGKEIWLDPSQPVAPFGMVAVNLRGKPALFLSPVGNAHLFKNVSTTLPFAAFQRVSVNATLGADGRLIAKVKYTLRGDNELLLRVAFHQTPKEKWKDVAGLLALTDGFRGVITSATASDPMATKDPFTVEYGLTQDKFVDWSKKPVRIPALLPQIGLPEVSGRNSAGNIELGTPLDVETQVTLHLPEGTTVQAPAGTTVQRDYATYSSKYGFTADTLTALRRIHFILREVPADRVIDYSAFVQAVQNDQSQYFVMDRGAGVKSAALQ